MIITYYGLQFFKIQFGDLTIAINPVKNRVRFGADIVLISVNYPDFNGVENLSCGDKEPFIISGPGEYEVKGVYVRGFSTETCYGDKKKRINTIYSLTLDGMDLCFLGALDVPTVAEGILEAINGVDILFVPVGGPAQTDGKSGLSSSNAHKVSLLFEPKIIVPMNFEEPALKKFLEEAGADGVEAVPKLVVKKKDVEGREGDIIVLKSVS